MDERYISIFILLPSMPLPLIAIVEKTGCFERVNGMKPLATSVVAGARPNFMKITPFGRALTAKKMGVKLPHFEAAGSRRILYK